MMVCNVRRFSLMLIPALLVWTSCGDPVEPPTGMPTVSTSVSVVDNRFQPTPNAIEVGETVTWLWTGNNPHNVTFDDETIGNSVTQQDGSFQQIFPDAGEYTYFCTVHGRSMSGTVVVGNASGTQPNSGTYP